MKLEGFYKQIIQSMPVHIYWKDINFRYLGCNLFQTRYLGLSKAEEVVGKTDFDLFDTKSAETIRKNDMKVLREKKPYLFEEPSFSKNKKKLLLTQKIPIYDINNKIYGIAGIAFDITQRKAHEEKIISDKSQIELTLKNIIEHLPGHVYWKDISLKFLGCNIQQARSAGFEKPEELVGKSDFDMPWKNEAAKLTKIDERVIAKKSDITKEETWISDETGKEITFLSKKTPLLNTSGSVIGLLGISLDITERKKMEEALKRAKEKSESANFIMTEFIANMGHDLATPISDVGSIAEVLHCYSDEYPELSELFETLRKRASDCEAVRKKIINATSISNLDIKPETFSMVSELLCLEHELRPLLVSKPIKLIIKPVKPKKNDLIETDRCKFHSILFDLISNAIKFTDKGEVRVAILKKTNHFLIEVKDTGVGIPEDKLEYIFEQYTKLERSNKFGSNFKGVGAGLYLSRIRSSILGATISVKSHVNKGSIFTLTIPAKLKK